VNLSSSLSQTEALTTRLFFVPGLGMGRSQQAPLPSLEKTPALRTAATDRVAFGNSSPCSLPLHPNSITVLKFVKSIEAVEYN
jgi:hypothetical protein